MSTNNDNLPVRYKEQSMGQHNLTHPMNIMENSIASGYSMNKTKQNRDASLFDQKDQPKPLMFD